MVSEAPKAAAARPITVDDLWAMERVGMPALSPDGRWVAFPVTTFAMDDDEGQTHLWLAAADGTSPARRLTWQKGAHTSPTWSPDSRRLAFVAKRGDDPAQLFLLTLDGGEAEPLTDLPIAVSDPRWFSDGRRIAFVAATFPGLDDDFEEVKKRVEELKDDKTQAKITESRLLRYWDQYRTDGTVPHIFEIDLESRVVHDLMPGRDGLMGFGGFAWDLAPDGSEIAFAANGTEPPWRDLRFDLFLLSVSSGEITSLTGDDPAYDTTPVYSPDGRFLIFGRSMRPDVSPDFLRLMRYDRESGEIVELIPGWDGEPGDWTFTADGATVLFHAQDGGRRHLYGVPVDASPPAAAPRLLARGGDTGGVRSAAGGRVVYARDAFDHPADLWTLELAADGTAGPPRRVTFFNEERLAALELGTVEDVTFDGAGGEPVQMFVVHPPGFDPQKRWPLLMLIHGGPHSAFLDAFHYRWNAQLFAAKGYVTALVNFHGSTGFGQAFAESILGAHAEKPFEDVMKATDFLLARGYIDEARLAAAGGSFGGYMTSWILGHTDRYAALVSHAAVYDLMAQFASDYSWNRSKNYGAEPWQDPARIDLWSPSRYARHFNTPTLVLHGELDYRVPVTQGFNLYGVLVGKGVPARIVVYPNENHWVLKPQAAKLWWEEVLGWLERYLGTGPTVQP